MYVCISSTNKMHSKKYIVMLLPISCKWPTSFSIIPQSFSVIPVIIK